MTTVRIYSREEIKEIVRKELLKEMEDCNEEFANLFQRNNQLEERIKILEKQNDL